MPRLNVYVVWHVSCLPCVWLYNEMCCVVLICFICASCLLVMCVLFVFVCVVVVCCYVLLCCVLFAYPTVHVLFHLIVYDA